MSFLSTKASVLIASSITLLLISTGVAGGEMVFRYNSPSVSSLGKDDSQSASPACYEAENIGTVGDKPGCDGMLIVSEKSLKEAGSRYTSENGNGFFYVSSGGKKYTFADSPEGSDDGNVFTGQVKNMKDLFQDTNFNGDIGYWDVSRVVEMTSPFAGATNFNQDIGSWDVSSVENMNFMFQSSMSFDQDITSWDVSNVEKMVYMFSFAKVFDQDIISWNVENVVSSVNFAKDSAIEGTSKIPDF